MKAVEVAERIIEGPLFDANLKYCLVDKNKVPFRYDGKNAHPNDVNDFCDIKDIVTSDQITKFPGMGISVQASNVWGIDIDHCVETPFNKDTINDFGKGIVNMFKDFAYIEFSFSGTGLRILFRDKIIDNYEDIYYIKNSKLQVEYYQPSKSNRYLTITGMAIYPNKIDSETTHSNIVYMFLNNYMRRPMSVNNKIDIIKDVSDDRSLEQLLNNIKCCMLADSSLTELWFHHAPGSGSNESECDYYLCNYIYHHITKDKDKIKDLFELSPYFKSKDSKHVYKWNYHDNRYYYNCIYKSIIKNC